MFFGNTALDTGTGEVAYKLDRAKSFGAVCGSRYSQVDLVLWDVVLSYSSSEKHRNLGSDAPEHLKTQWQPLPHNKDFDYTPLFISDHHQCLGFFDFLQAQKKREASSTSSEADPRKQHRPLLGTSESLTRGRSSVALCDVL